MASLSESRITLRFDGGSRGNPGPAGIGVVLETDDGTPIRSLGRFIGRATSNFAEYTGLLTGLEVAQKLGVRHLRILGDSQLVIFQLQGRYKVRHETLLPLYKQAQQRIATFPRVEIAHNRRGHNTLADALANLAMDRKRDVTEADLPGGGVSFLSSADLDDPENLDSDDSTTEQSLPPQPAGPSGPSPSGSAKPSQLKSTRSSNPSDSVGALFEAARPYRRPGLECPHCGCRLAFITEGTEPPDPEPFICRCGTPMIPEA